MAPMEGPVSGSVSAADASAAFSATAADVASASSPLGNGGAGAGAGGRVPKWKGRILKRFKLVDLLGQGAMGKVFRAEDVTLRRYVALKVLPTKTKEGQRDHKVDQFVREARSAATLDHPNAVTIYEIGESSGVHYIAMELVEGGNLEKLIKASGPMEIDRGCQIAAEAAEALSAAHQLGIVHRDVKPSNLLLARNGRCKLADFGLARFDDPDDLTPRGECVGTPCYIAPEIPLGQRATPQSDIYSLGCTLWFLLTGRPPFEAKSKQDMMKMHVYASLPDLLERRPDVPERLVETINRACAKNPTDRFESADQFAKTLRTFTIRTGAGTGSSSGRLPTLAGATSNSGSMPGWSPDAPMTASSSNLGPHLSHGSAASLGAIPAVVPYAQPQPKRSLKVVLTSPLVLGACGTFAAAVLIGAGVWIARGGGGSSGSTVAAQSKAAPAAPTPTVPARPAATGAPGDVSTGPDLLVNGGLEKDDAVDGIAGWYVHPKYAPLVRFETEAGNRFVRIVPQSESDTPHVDQKVDLDPDWTAVTLAGRMRASDFKPGPKQPHDARIAVEFFDGDDQPVGGAPGNVPLLKGDSPWVEKLVTVRIPPGAKWMHVKLAVTGATGTVDFDDVRVMPQMK